MKNLQKLAANLFNSVLNNELGGTFDFNGNKVEMQKGYFVGITGIQIPKMYFINPKYPINVLLHTLDEMQPPQVFDLIGFWINQNIVYIDYVVYTDNLETALNLGKINNQKAVWDCKNQKEIFI